MIQHLITLVSIALLVLFVYRGYVRAPAPVRGISSYPQHVPFWVEQEVCFYAPGPVLPSADARVTTRCPNTFHGRRLAIPQEIAMHFEVRDLLIGDESQLESIGVAPDEALALNERCLPFAPVYSGTELTIIVRNRSRDPQHFQAALVGRGEVL